MKPDDASLAAFQERLSHTFADTALLREALTHPSARNGKADNERLEFLGDAVLQLVVTEMLYEAFPETDEGRMTPWRAALVSRAPMAALAETWGLGELLALSSGEERSGGRTRQSNLANAVEAIIGAVFRDGGWDAARHVVRRWIEEPMRRLAALPDGGDPNPSNAKGHLQELLQRDGGETPRYQCIREEGAAHERRYEVVVEWHGKELGRGEGRSKQEAEVNAARAALTRRQ